MSLYDIMCEIDSEIDKLRGADDILWLMVQAGNDKNSDITLSSMNDGFRFLEAGVSGCVENLTKLSDDVRDFFAKEKETKQEVQTNE